jgi:multicomponent Na+:H+ antiporter subunit E
VRTLLFVLALDFIWVLLWGSASVANVISGLVVGFVIVLAVPGLIGRSRRGWPPVRPLAVLRLVGHVVVSTVASNVVLTREILSRGSQIRTGVVGVPLPDCSDELVTLIADLLALAPGTIPIEVTKDPQELYVHVLHLDDVDEVRGQIYRLTDLVVRAFGSLEAIAAQDAFVRSGGR